MSVPEHRLRTPGVLRHGIPLRLARAQPGRWGRAYLERVGALVVAYYAAAHVGYALQFSGPVAAVVWLPVGVGIAFLYLGGMRLWPGLVVGDLLVNNYAALPLGSAVGQSFGNLLEIVVATGLALRLCPREHPLGSLGGVTGLVAAIAAGTVLSATIGTLSSWLGGVIDGHALPYVWRTWWLGDFCGALIVVPLALSWWPPPARPWPRSRVLEGAVMALVVAGLSALDLTAPAMTRTLMIPALIWAALRLGPRGATLAITIISGSAVWGATNNLGPFGIGSISGRLLDVQVFIATVSFSALTIAALVSERARLADGVRASRARLVAVSDEARRRLERDLHDGAQQGLIGLRLKLAQANEAMAEEPAEGRRLVALVERQVDDVLQTLRAAAGGVYPPLLHERGLVEALRSVARRSPCPVTVHADLVARCPETVESAVYFCCLEALQNVAKHAGPGAAAAVRIRGDGPALRFEVSDSGPGFDAEHARDGNGLANMRDRIEAVGGRLSVVARRDRGTTVRGHVPLR